jgi:hypothetical protein
LPGTAGKALSIKTNYPSVNSNIMIFFFFNHPEKKYLNQEYQHSIVVDESFHNITEGGEFLDDAIRMKEQPFMYAYTKDRIAARSPEYLDKKNPRNFIIRKNMLQ